MTPRELERLTEYPVFHNNLVVDMLTVRFPFGSAEFVALREQIWITVFAEAARINRSLIFTFAPEATVQPGFPRRVVDVVEFPGGRVALTVDAAEQERRILETQSARVSQAGRSRRAALVTRSHRASDRRLMLK